METASKKMLVERVHDKLIQKYGAGAPHRVMLLEVFDAFVEEMITVVETGDRIELRGFGVFNPTLRKARVARNPKTLETVNVPPRNAVTFKPGKDFKDRLNPKRSAATR